MSAGADKGGDVGVGDGHAAEVERLEALERRGELVDPWRGVGAPVVGDEPVHGGAGLALERERLEPREPLPEARGARGVAEGDGDVLARERVDAVPAAAHPRRRLPVPRVLDVAHHEVQRLVGDPVVEAERPVEPPRLRHLATHRIGAGSAAPSGRLAGDLARTRWHGATPILLHQFPWALSHQRASELLEGEERESSSGQAGTGASETQRASVYLFPRTARPVVPGHVSPRVKWLRPPGTAQCSRAGELSCQISRPPPRPRSFVRAEYWVPDNIPPRKMHTRWHATSKEKKPNISIEFNAPCLA